MRGPLNASRLRELGSRITPAYAGTTYSSWPSDRGQADHPRLCGDHLGFLNAHIFPLGSPPLMRGPLMKHDLLARPDRITPAYAGTTSVRVLVGTGAEDHPRLCGDHHMRKLAGFYKQGSPPLMRGPHVSAPQRDRAVGITPAYAGTTVPITVSDERESDYPRLCGDHRLELIGGYAHLGSPPLMRGPPIVPTCLPFPDGITPAYAGTTNCALSTSCSTADHPRLCGDHVEMRERGCVTPGSPPLMRGPPSAGMYTASSLRITPAYAGTTL